MAQLYIENCNLSFAKSNEKRAKAVTRNSLQTMLITHTHTAKKIRLQLMLQAGRERERTKADIEMNCDKTVRERELIC